MFLSSDLHFSSAKNILKKLNLVGFLLITWYLHVSSEMGLALQLGHSLRNLWNPQRCNVTCAGILNLILDTSKVESGKMQLDEVEFNLADVLEESMDMINIVGISKGLEVVFDPCDLSILKCGNVIGDCRRLKQILDNILGNSVKFTQQGHVILRAWANRTITSSPVSVPSRFGCLIPGANFLCLFKTRERHADCHSFSLVQNDPNSIEFYFEVDDTGIGIPKEKRELVFEDYVQVKEGQGGTGLGLGIVQSFVSSISLLKFFMLQMFLMI